MPLDSVPQWVQEKVSEEEYKLWKTMSSVFRIDYSFLKKELSLEKRKEFYNSLKQMCKSIENGEYISKKGELFAVSFPAPIDTQLEWRICELIQIDEHIKLCKKKANIYQGRQNENACLECIVWYLHNSQTKKVEILKYETSTTLGFSKFQGVTVFSVRPDESGLMGSCSGTLEYYDAMRNYQTETVHKRFIVPL